MKYWHQDLPLKYYFTLSTLINDAQVIDFSYVLHLNIHLLMQGQLLATLLKFYFRIKVFKTFQSLLLTFVLNQIVNFISFQFNLVNAYQLLIF